MDDITLKCYEILRRTLDRFGYVRYGIDRDTVKRLNLELAYLGDGSKTLRVCNLDIIIETYKSDVSEMLRTDYNKETL